MPRRKVLQQCSGRLVRIGSCSARDQHLSAHDHGSVAEDDQQYSYESVSDVNVEANACSADVLKMVVSSELWTLRWGGGDGAATPAGLELMRCGLNRGASLLLWRLGQCWSWFPSCVAVPHLTTECAFCDAPSALGSHCFVSHFVQ